MEALGRAGLYQAKAKLDDFMIGFNQAAPRFSFLDVGSGKEVADAKVKGGKFPFSLLRHSAHIVCSWHSSSRGLYTPASNVQTNFWWWVSIKGITNCESF